MCRNLLCDDYKNVYQISMRSRKSIFCKLILKHARYGFLKTPILSCALANEHQGEYVEA